MKRESTATPWNKQNLETQALKLIAAEEAITEVGAKVAKEVEEELKLLGAIEA